mmetsp:Transcript_5091/g.10724  ORF Transcript_5091/g.10724 Transcript_5091/m.10724 type:complete len:405 (+) Transcript_5091:201-1415(+)
MMSNQSPAVRTTKNGAFVSLPISICCWLLLLISCSANASQRDADAGYARLQSWMRENGGRVNDRFGITEKDGIRGIQAFTDIEEGSELLFCPWHLVIGSSSLQDQMKPGDGMCSVVDEMAKEIRLGVDSLWFPYLDHIGGQRLPADFISEVLLELQGLLTTQDATRHLRWFDQRCDGELDGTAKQSLVAFISRASEVGMIPIYDLFNHHNGKRSAKLTVTEEGVQLLVVGNGGISSGDEIYLSYGLKTASTMYRDYGFVEEWPIAWNFQTAEGNNFAFLEFPDVVAINPSADLLRAVWQSNKSLEEYLSLATTHTESLSSADLETFATAVENEHFPTTFEGDEVTLALLIEQEGGTIANDSSDSISDRISAIRYRMAHKKALASAKLYCNGILTKRMSMGSQEL